MLKQTVWINFIVLGVVAAFPFAEESNASQIDQTGILLLHNGNIVQGTILQKGDRYLVKQGKSEIRFAASEVEYVCRDLQQAYQYKFNRLARADIQAQIKMIEWCLRHDLGEHAMQHLRYSVSIDPNYPGLESLHRRIVSLARLKISQATRKSTVRSSSPTLSKKIATKKTQQANENLAKQLPKGAMGMFSRTVQPILINRCGMVGCHGRRSTASFQLQRITNNSLRQRQAIFSNLSETLKRVDRKHPEKSLLLNIPLKPHGTAKKPVFSPRQQNQYDRLVQWVNMIAEPDKNETNRPKTIDMKRIGTPKISQNPLETSPKENSFLRDTKQGVTAPSEESAQHPEISASFSTLTRSPRKIFIPKDPFDPEIFNRKYFPEGKPKSPEN